MTQTQQQRFASIIGSQVVSLVLLQEQIAEKDAEIAKLKALIPKDSEQAEPSRPKAVKSA